MNYTKNRHLIFAGFFLFTALTACSEAPEKEQKTTSSETTDASGKTDSEEVPQVELKKNPSDFIPDKYVLSEKIEGDLNKDGVNDCVLLIKGTDKEMIVEDETQGPLDQNRRGIIVLIKHDGGYEEIVKNLSCFSSENEDGGVYYPPELELGIAKGNLLVQYTHGRYGYWSYTFRHTNGDMELIGYDRNNNYGPITESITSINFLTKKKQVKENVNENTEESGDEVFKETWSKIKIDQSLKLSEIKDFDELDMSKY